MGDYLIFIIVGVVRHLYHVTVTHHHLYRDTSRRIGSRSKNT